MTHHDPYALCASLVPFAMRIVGTVHAHGDRTDELEDLLRSRLRGVVPVEWIALIVVLAAMVDPEQNATQLLGWTEELSDERRQTRAVMARGGGPVAVAHELGVSRTAAHAMYERERRRRAA